MFAESPMHDGRVMDRLDLVARKGGTSVAVCLPARNEEATIGSIVEAIRRDLVEPGGRHGGLVDELVVMDDRSSDATVQLAEAAGAVVVDVAAVLPEAGRASGKGNALWKSVAATSSDIVVWCDADLREFDTVFVTGLVGPLLLETDVVFVKGAYERILDGERGEGGRTTELMARPLLSLLFPELTVIRQPLGGEYAGRRSVLEQVPFVQGYGVELGLLIDIARLVGVDRIAQVDLGVRRHRNRTLHELSAQAMEILQTGLDRAGTVTERDWSHVLQRPGAGPLEVELRERPPLASVPGYRSARATSPAALRTN